MFELEYWAKRFRWIIAFIFLIMLYNLGGWGPLETSEARYAQIGKEMAESGDIMHPRLLGIQHFHKPPVTYAITAAGIKIWGANPFGIRFFLQVAFILQLILVFQLAKLLLADRTKALLAALIYGTMPLVLISVRNLTTDAYLNTFEILAILCAAWYYAKNKVRYLYLFSIALSLAFLTKGPVGLILPLLILVPLNQLLLRQPVKWNLHHLGAFISFIILGTSWYVLLIAENPRFFDYFFLKHTVERFANAKSFARSEPWWYYLVFMTAAVLPWSAMLISKGKTLIKKNAAVFPGTWALFGIILPLIFFSLSSSKLILYVLPLAAPMAILCSFVYFKLNEKGKARWSTIFGIFQLILASTFILLPALDSKAVFSTALFLISIVWIVAVLLLLLIKKTAPIRIAVLSLVMILFLIPASTHYFEKNETAANGTSEVANFIRSKHLENQHLLVYNKLLPSLAFQLDKALIFLNNGEFLLQRETLFEKDDAWKKNLIDLSSESEKTYLNQLLEEPCVLIIHKRIKEESAQWLPNRFEKHEKIGKWEIYFNVKPLSGGNASPRFKEMSH